MPKSDCSFMHFLKYIDWATAPRPDDILRNLQQGSKPTERVWGAVAKKAQGFKHAAELSGSEQNAQGSMWVV